MNVVWTFDTFEYYFGIIHRFTKYLKENCGFGFEKCSGHKNIFKIVRLFFGCYKHSGLSQRYNFDEIFLVKSLFVKIFEREMLTTTLLQIYCKIVLNSKVIVKSIFVPDDNFWNTKY